MWAFSPGASGYSASLLVTSWAESSPAHCTRLDVQTRKHHPIIWVRAPKASRQPSVQDSPLTLTWWAPDTSRHKAFV